MKRRAKLSLKRNSDKPKRTRTIDDGQQRGSLDEEIRRDSLATASGTAIASSLGEADPAVGDSDVLESRLVSSISSSVGDEAFLASLASNDGDCRGEAPGSLDYPMSCHSVETNSCDVPCSSRPAGSGHQMETEEFVEEGKNIVISSHSDPSSQSPKQDTGLENIDYVADPISDSNDDDLCTQFDSTDTTQYTLLISDIAEFEDFDVPPRPCANPSIKRQTSLLSYMSGANSSSSPVTATVISNDKHRPPCNSSSRSNCELAGSRKGEGPAPVQCDTATQASDCSRRNSKVKKTCPFYKKIPGTGFTVDAFSYGSIPDCSSYFLSHFHYDHYMGLTKKFQHPIYCSQITANLVKQQLKVSQHFIHALDMNCPHLIDGVEVTLLNANHCPGSVLFLFKLASGRHYLHTGDFRFCAAMKNYPQLMSISINQLFLDTTYCSPEYTFPRQEEVISFAVDKAAAALHVNPATLLVCGTYTIGKERVFMGVAATLGLKVFVNHEKKIILECLESPEISSVLTNDPSSAGLHVLPMAKLNMNDLSQHLEKWQSNFSSVLAFKPTGWTYSSKNVSLASIKPQSHGPVKIYGVPYSEHSSFSELREFVQFLRPERIIPTVNNHSAKKRDEMQKHFRQWLTQQSQPKKAIQTTLDRTFSSKI